jgi:hypothetical protein
MVKNGVVVVGGDGAGVGEGVCVSRSGWFGLCQTVLVRKLDCVCRFSVGVSARPCRGRTGWERSVGHHRSVGLRSAWLHHVSDGTCSAVWMQGARGEGEGEENGQGLGRERIKHFLAEKLRAISTRRCVRTSLKRRSLGRPVRARGVAAYVA